jgi:hypothetical protein
MATKLQKFIKKLSKLDKTDYTVTLCSPSEKSEYLPECCILLLDYNETTKEHVNYTNEMAVNNLIKWLYEKCEIYDVYGNHAENYYFYFHRENFAVRVECLSYDGE